MPDVDNLVDRIDAEFTAAETHLKTFQERQVRDYEGRVQRLEQLDQVFLQLREIWRPRLETLAKKFGDKVKVTPYVTPSAKEATFTFQSSIAHIVLRFGAMTDADVRKVILTYDLEILPIFMQFQSHTDMEFPLDHVDLKAAGEWIDDQIIGFVKTYLSLHEHQQYLKNVMVSDPVAGVEFPKFAAATTIEHAGKTYHFISDATRQEFEKQKGIAPK